jgi:dihydroorotase/N-acyl-D-amino-acid deacylase
MKFATDASGMDPDSSAGTMTHPRAYGNYPRILGRYVREQKVLTLEDAIRKMTWSVASRLSIRDRGLLNEGMYADIVVFDPNTIIDRSTYENPHQLSVGMKHVFVNGVEVVTDGKSTGAKPGMAVRGPGWKGVTS